MSRLPNVLRLLRSDAERAEAQRAALREDYLDHVCAPLVGIIPYAERQSLRAEVASHLDALIEDAQFAGKSVTEATEAALTEFGEPWKVGEAFLREWVQGAPDAGPKRLRRQAATRAFAFFGPFTVATLLLLEQSALTPNSDGSLRSWAWLLAVLTPFLAGLLTGLALPPRVTACVAWAVGLLALDTAATGLVLLPHQEGLDLALFQIFLWLPAGCLTASLTAHVVRQRRRQQFRHLAR